MARILIVDDEPVNRELLHAFLDGSGHVLIDAASGEAALAAVDAHGTPDVVLLDVMLPGIDGYETTARLKERTRDEFMPIILVTALYDQGARLQGLRAGADEFLTKPVDRHELGIRIAHLLALREKEAALTQRNVEMVEMERSRVEMAQMIVHDLKNPLSVVLSNIEYAIEDQQTSADSRDALKDSREAGQRVLRLIANLLDLTKFENGRLQAQRTRAPVSALIEPLVQQRRHHAAQARDIAITTAIPGDVIVNADVDLMSRVVENIFDNALRHTSAGGRIVVEARPTAGAVELRIGHTGAAIPPSARQIIFEKFGQVGAGIGRMNLGLGLYFCRLATEAHGGRIWVEETRELPTVFGLELPA